MVEYYQFFIQTETIKKTGHASYISNIVDRVCQVIDKNLEKEFLDNMR